jgi:hypothetical protein
MKIQTKGILYNQNNDFRPQNTEDLWDDIIQEMWNNFTPDYAFNLIGSFLTQEIELHYCFKILIFIK